MKREGHQQSTCVALAMLLYMVCSTALAAPPPNVILIVTDDMGWGDPGSYGFDRGIETPALDQMAAEGMRFTNWYGEASCTPGRAAIQTGRLPRTVSGKTKMVCQSTSTALTRAPI